MTEPESAGTVGLLRRVLLHGVMEVQQEDLDDVPYMIAPRSSDEARHGKPILVTDSEIAVLLDLMVSAEPKSDCAREVLTSLWEKFFTAWQDTPPYENTV